MEKYKDPSFSPQERAEDLVSRMTTEEKMSQLLHNAPEIKRLGIPAYNWWSEGLHGAARAGTATMFPQAIGLAAIFDEGLIKEAGEITSTEARAIYNIASAYGDRDIFKGLTLWSPNINIFRDPRWGRGQETFGEDPFLTSKLGVAFTEGLQGDSEVLRTAACAKHYAGHSGPEISRHEFDAKISEKDLEETYLPAFKALVSEAKVEGVMGAYNRLNGEGACASSFLMNKLDEWGFNGYFVSDCHALDDFHDNHGLTKSAAETCAVALKSGCNINCGITYSKLSEALEKNLISESDINTACVCAMRTRMRLGMFNEKTEYDDIPYSVVSCDSHKQKSRKLAEKSMVLLKNNGILPLDKSKVKSIAVIGPNAYSREALTGNYCSTADNYVTFLDGIRNSFGGRIYYSEGCHLWKESISVLALPGDRLSEAVAAAKSADVVILCLGLDFTIEGEQGDTGNEFSSGDKNDLRLPYPQRKLLDEIIKTGKPCITVVAAGSSINPEQFTDALIHAWYPGQEGGNALADILFGNVSPSGKLPVTFYEKVEKLPDFSDYSMANRTYRNITDNVLFPFGFGLTYTKFVCNDLKFENKIATVRVKNVGDTASEDVIQFYIKDFAEQAVKNYSLCGFKRIFLIPGEEAEVSVIIPDSAFEVVENNGERKVVSDSFILYAGTFQPDSISEKLSQTQTLSLKINL